MEYETWVQASNHLVTAVIKTTKTISSTDLVFYSLYIAVMVIGVRFKIEKASPKNVLPLVLTLMFSAITYHYMISSTYEIEGLTQSEIKNRIAQTAPNYYIIITMFYVQGIFQYLSVNLKTSISCAIMAVYLFIMSREAKYYEIHGSSFSDVLHDSYWLVILLLHCIICGSFFTGLQYKRAYLGLRKLICSRKVY